MTAKKTKSAKKESNNQKEKNYKEFSEQNIKELTQTLQHLQADFENYQKRTEIEKLEFMKYANKNMVLEILPVLDNFELALKHTSNKEEFIKGIDLVYANLRDTLGKAGLKQIQALKTQFDPEKHEALMQETSKEKSGTIIEEFQKGYTLNDKVIRPTKVKVAKKG
ncbi:nucleotide exchange factor GrpE [Candidatus Woesearchaeota archaeon]|nr:nucleotide exchange factor GrpE [Candidatus Woesearchaeota archaeon]